MQAKNISQIFKQYFHCQYQHKYTINLCIISCTHIFHNYFKDTLILPKLKRNWMFANASLFVWWIGFLIGFRKLLRYILCRQALLVGKMCIHLLYTIFYINILCEHWLWNVSCNICDIFYMSTDGEMCHANTYDIFHVSIDGGMCRATFMIYFM